MQLNIYFILFVVIISVILGKKICHYYNRNIMFKKIDFDSLSILL